MTSFIGKDGMPVKDPYQILGIPTTASATDIKKAYKQLALKVHPDKQAGTTLTDSQRDALNKQFQDIKDARSFLLDADHAEARKKYVANLASERARHAEEERRGRTMSSRRKRMREELSMRERMATTTASSSSAGGAAGASTSGDGNDHRFDVDRLRREGERLREEYSNREAEVDLVRKQRMAVERATQKLQREDRQVRLKWSRKKVVGGVHTIQSLTSIMNDFGEVDEVEMLGSKGNAALVTFSNVSSCKPCVSAYRNSGTMRATYVGRRKIDDATTGGGDESNPSSHHVPAFENPKDRNLRQAAERERLMRQMELEEAGGGGGGGGRDPVSANISSQKRTTSNDRWAQGEQKTPALFPPIFPPIPENEGLTPFELLDKYEKIIFDDISQ